MQGGEKEKALWWTRFAMKVLQIGKHDLEEMSFIKPEAEARLKIAQEEMQIKRTFVKDEAERRSESHWKSN